MAAALNGTDMNADGEGDYALCVDIDWSELGAQSFTRHLAVLVKASC